MAYRDKAVEKERRAEYKRRNAARIAARMKRWYELRGKGLRKIRAAALREYNRARHKANPDAKREKNRRYYSRRREQILMQKREYNKLNAERVRRYKLKTAYGITQADYDRMLSEQGGKCGICGSLTPGAKTKNRFYVDHCHATGRVRALLCSRCNTGIGMLRESPELLRSAAAYIEKHNATETPAKMAGAI